MVNHSALVKILLVVTITAPLFAATAIAAEPTLLWTLENVFESPESAVIDPQREMIYVTNVNGYARDGNGYVSKISLSGEIVNLKWITGINSPTGISLFQDRLYFADYDVLVIADAATGNILKRVPVPENDTLPMLNDVAISNSGEVYVSASKSRVIYQLNEETLEVFFADQALLEKANGLLSEENYLVHGGLLWSVFDVSNQSVVEQSALPFPQPPLQEFDGITRDGQGGYLVTLINDARIWRIPAEGEQHPLSNQPWDGIDLLYHEGLLAVPRVGGSLSLFRLEQTP